MKRAYIASWAVLAVLLHGCALMGLPAAETFNQRLEGGYRTAETIVSGTSILLNAHKISSDDAENSAKQADVLKDGLDVARSLHATDEQAGNDKLTTTLISLRALEAYLQTKE